MSVAGESIRAALASVGAVGGQIRPLPDLAAGANDALRQAPAGLTVAGAAAFLATMAQESAWFRTTEEYRKDGRYAPYIGRTFEQITWRDNYRKFGQWCQAKGLTADSETFVTTPTSLADYKWAWLGGLWYFEANRLWDYANRGDFLAVQRGVNLGNPLSRVTPAGWKTRKAIYDAFLSVGETLLPDAEAPATRVIEGVTYTLRTSRYGTYVSYQNESVDPDDLVRILSTTRYALDKTPVIVQGGLSDGALSGGTHRQLGVYDISVRGWTKDDVWQWCRIAQWNAIRPFPRGFTRDSFQGKTIGDITDGNEHLHVLVGQSLFPRDHPARYQQIEYDARGDGLVGNAGYTGPWNRVSDKSWAESPYNPANRQDGKQQYIVTVGKGSDLLGLDADRVPRLTRQDGGVIDSVAVVNRWGRDNALTVHGNFYARQYLTLKSA